MPDKITPDHDNDDASDSSEVKDQPPGPADHGGKGGMATREVAPELAEPDR